MNYCELEEVVEYRTGHCAMCAQLVRTLRQGVCDYCYNESPCLTIDLEEESKMNEAIVCELCEKNVPITTIGKCWVLGSHLPQLIGVCDKCKSLLGRYDFIISIDNIACPNCNEPTMLTQLDVARGYCSTCADRLSSGWY